MINGTSSIGVAWLAEISVERRCLLLMNDEIFASRFQKLVSQHGGIGRALCALLEVPYYEDRESEKLLGHRRVRQEALEGSSPVHGARSENTLEEPLLPTREFLLPDGSILCTNVWSEVPADAKQLTEEVWTRDNYPDSYNSIPEAVSKLQHGVKGGYYHKSQANLVLISGTDEKVGIRRAEFILPTRSMLAARIAPLSLLRKVATA